MQIFFTIFSDSFWATIWIARCFMKLAVLYHPLMGRTILVVELPGVCSGDSGDSGASGGSCGSGGAGGWVLPGSWLIWLASAGVLWLGR